MELELLKNFDLAEIKQAYLDSIQFVYDFE